MNKNTIRRLRRKLQKLRNQAKGGIPSKEMIRLAESVGRKRSKRGSEPNFVSELLPDSRPISIPSHPKPLNRFVAGNILDALEADLDALEEIYEEE